MEKKIEINVVTVGLFLLLIFFLGFLTRKEIVNRKEIRNLHAQISGKENLIDKMKDTISFKSDTILTLREIINSNSGKISSLKGKVNYLEAKIKDLEVNLPPNEVYANLQKLIPDTLKKEWPFSTPQINTIYKDEEELEVRREEVVGYESITEMLVYNIMLLEKTESLKSDQLDICLRTTDEYQKMMDLKDKEIKEWKKRGDGRMAWGITSTGLAGIFLALLIF
jgi:chromosome segregation ATPase